jgi:cyclic dehypoxanthinyl futalosine synthase
MPISRQQALDYFHSPDLIGLGFEADAVRRRLHPEGVVTYIIDRNINYTNFCTEYCTFCAFYRPLPRAGKPDPRADEGYILDFEKIYEKIAETLEMGGTGVLMQGGIHPDLKIDWFERLFKGIKQRFPQIWLHCLSASEVLAIAEYSDLDLRTPSRGCATRDSTPSPAAAPRFSTTKCAIASRASSATPRIG